MADNRLTARLAQSQAPSRDLDQFVYEANQNWFVRDSGKLYFVNSRPGADGVSIRFMDRHI